ncbi:MAG: hypothetical protein QNJ72_37310 [Pleurocapsa sp. MO_226.B13]|nr:hypothetical protein [Pleurocapsa sp. MO_226.B13]
MTTTLSVVSTTGITVEPIETTEQLTQLKNLGCQFGQGYLFAEPSDVQEIESMLVNDRIS